MNCPKCDILLEVVRNVYAKQLQQRCLKVCGEVSRSISGLRVIKLAQTLGTGVVSTSGIIKLCSKSGLTFIKPYTGKWSQGLRGKLIFTGISNGITAYFWIKAIGYGIVSLTVLAIAILFGLSLPLITRQIFKKRLVSACKKFWESKPEIEDQYPPIIEPSNLEETPSLIREEEPLRARY
jgi:hypothetical protein